MRGSWAMVLMACACSGAPAVRVAPAPTPLAALAPVAASADRSAPSEAGAVVEVPGAEPETCGATPSALGNVQSEQLNEVSGVVESRLHPEVLFVHNDSGDSPRFFAINRRGKLLAELVLETVPILIDAEEIAFGPAPNGAQYLYLGDTGNNWASFRRGIPRRKAVLWRVPEPDISPAGNGAKLGLRDAFQIVFTFPDGARDVEAFFIDPLSGDLFMLSKQPDGHSQLLTASAAVLAGGGDKLRLVRELHFGQPPLGGSTMPTAADISRDGSRILVRTYTSVFLFRRAPGESVAAALGRAPEVLASPHEPQGEAIAFVDRDSAYLTISEGVKPALNCARLPP